MKLFTSINCERTVKYITDKIYNDREKYFPTTPESPQAPPRSLFEKYFMQVLLQFSSFQTLSGFYRQKSGLSMGSKISPSLANIFCHMMEENIIQGYIDKGIIISYQRYVDDVAVILKKGYKEEILKKMNDFDPSLKWTSESMQNNTLPFLDTLITLENDNLELYQYRKSNDSECLTNYRHGVSPKSYKTSLLTGEIYRVYNCTTSEKAREEALTNLERIFRKNLYPPKLISEKIMEIKKRNFGPNPNKAKRIAEEQNPEIKRSR